MEADLDADIEFDLDYVLDSIAELKHRILELNNQMADLMMNLRTHTHIQ